MTFKSGKKATCTISGTEVPLKNWHVNPNIDKVRFLNSKSNSFYTNEPTNKSATFGFELDFDFDSSPFAAPLNLVIGSQIVNVKLFLDGTSGKFWTFPIANVYSTPQSAAVAGGIGNTFEAEVSGTFSYPDGITP